MIYFYYKIAAIMNHYQYKNIRSPKASLSFGQACLSLGNLLLVFLCALPLSLQAQVSGNDADTIAVTQQKVHVPYGIQNKDEITGAISTVSGSELYKTHTSTLSNTLFGRLPGVAALHQPGAPGYDEASLFIRGLHTFDNNGFLVLLDGFQIDSYNQISVDEIESISVLKDAAALALYGVLGANGVILITTKRGTTSDKIDITFKARYGYQTPEQLPEFADSYDYARLYNKALVNDGLQPLYTDEQLEGYKSGSNPYLYPDVNWYDEILRKGSPIQDYSLSFNGGNDRATYFLMLGFMNNEGLYANTDQENSSNISFQRINFRANADINITKNLSAQVGLGGVIEDRKYPPVSTQSLWQSMATYAPNLYPLKTPKGEITGSANFPNNPLGYILERGYQSQHKRNVQATVRLNEKLDFITKGLNLFGAVSFSSVLRNGYDKTRNYAYYEPIMGTSATGQDSLYFQERGVDTDLTVNVGNNYENHRMNFEGGFDYEQTMGDHKLGVLAMYHQDVYSYISTQAPIAFQNIMGRINYGYKGKYFAQLAMSYSGTEKYAPGERFGFFPAVSAGWLIHKEDFWNEAATMSYFKLRGSAGLVGNYRGGPRFNYNQYWGTATSQGYYFGTGQQFYDALVQLGVANPDMTWETALMYNVGVETKWFADKLSVNADVFYENRSDILVNMGNVTPALSGASEYAVENRGEVNNYGTEIEAMYNNSAGELDYYVGGHFSFARSKVIENYETPKREEYSERKGHPVSQYFGLEAIGFFKDESDIISSPTQTFSTVRPGDLKYKDQNNDGVIDVNDEVAIGRHHHPEISYAFNAGLAYKGFDLGVLFTGTANRSVYLNGYMFWPFVDDANISKWAAEGHWTPETHAEATFPRLTTEPNANNYRASTFWVRNVNQLRLRNIELGYTLPESALQKFRIENLRIFVSGLNLLSWDDLAVDVNPETLNMGYPILKTYTAGLSLNF